MITGLIADLWHLLQWLVQLYTVGLTPPAVPSMVERLAPGMSSGLAQMTSDLTTTLRILVPIALVGVLAVVDLVVRNVRRLAYGLLLLAKAVRVLWRLARGTGRLARRVTA